MDKLLFWPLDITYTSSEDCGEIKLWGISGENKRIVLVDRTFKPYFYAVPKNQSSLEALFRELEKLSRIDKKVLSVEKTEKYYFGKPITVIKITLISPLYLNEWENKIRRHPLVSEILESDIRYSMRYLIDKDIYPCNWYLANVEEFKGSSNVSVDQIFMLNSMSLYNGGGVTLPKLKILAFDVQWYSPKGSPKPETSMVALISIATNTGIMKQFFLEDMDEKEILSSFSSFILNFDPDIIVGFNINKFTWPLLLSRAKILDENLNISREYSSPQTSLYGHISIAGRANIDLMDYAESLYEIKIKTLPRIAEYLGIDLPEGEKLITSPLIYSYWKNKEKRVLLSKHSALSAKIILEIFKKALPFITQLSNVTGLPLDQVLAAPVGFRVEWFLIRQAVKDNELIPRRAERPYYPYKGAFVLKPRSGLHENIAVLDFSSMYPNIMIKYNISPDTYLPSVEELSPEEFWMAPEVGHPFRKHPPGFYKRVLEKLLSLRSEIKKQLKNLQPSSLEYLLLDNRQKAVKIIANACYGYTGWLGARWYVKPCAEATAAFGRKIIKETISIAKAYSLKIVYGDTDSIFVVNEPEKISKFIETVEKKLGLNIKIDKIYTVCLFTEAAKRYAGLLPDGRIDVIGFEAVRGDWCELAQEVQLKVIELVLKAKSPLPAIKYVNGIISNLKRQKIPFEKLIIWKTISRPIDKYEVVPPHVAVAKSLIDMGYAINVGDKVGYVVTKGDSKKLSERAKPYFMVNYSDIDIDYYISKQVIPAALRILSIFNVTERNFLRKTSTLDSWFIKRSP
ncbi:MAG: DNA polymerase II [Candidatus Methanomethylicota archaeon]|nr:MAG: DNA polymerase II [Candidatus Verstraetearchaeota archaeon]